MTTDNIIDLLIIACSGLLVWSVAVTLTLWHERKDMKKLHKSKEALRESMSNTNYDLHQQLEQVKKKKKNAQRKKLTAEIHALRTQLHQLRTEKQKQGTTKLNSNKAMPKEQKEVLKNWYLNILVTYRIDLFRGSAFSAIVKRIALGDPVEEHIDRAKKVCHVADRLGFEPDRKDYTELLREIRKIAKEVPLSSTAQIAIGYVFGGEWEEAEEALDKLRSERNEQN